MRTVDFKLKSGENISMSVDEVARWACLIEGVEFVANKCEELGMGMNNDEWIKPLAFQKYIDERFHAMKHDVTVEMMMGRL